LEFLALLTLNCNLASFDAEISQRAKSRNSFKTGNLVFHAYRIAVDSYNHSVKANLSWSPT